MEKSIVDTRETFAIRPPPEVEEKLSNYEQAVARTGSIFRRAGWAITDYFKVAKQVLKNLFSGARWRAASGRVMSDIMSEAREGLMNMMRIAEDYASVGRGLLLECRTKPFKALCVGGLLASLYVTYKMNPDEQSLMRRLAECRHQMALTPTMVQSSKANSRLHYLSDLYNSKRVQLVDCYLFSLVLTRPDSSDCSLYSTQDSTLRGWWWEELYRNTIDIGAYNRFWNLEKSFVDYDVHEEEFQLKAQPSNTTSV